MNHTHRGVPVFPLLELISLGIFWPAPQDLLHTLFLWSHFIKLLKMPLTSLPGSCVSTLLLLWNTLFSGLLGKYAWDMIFLSPWMSENVLGLSSFFIDSLVMCRNLDGKIHSHKNVKVLYHYLSASGGTVKSDSSQVTFSPSFWKLIKLFFFIFNILKFGNDMSHLCHHFLEFLLFKCKI